MVINVWLCVTSSGMSVSNEFPTYNNNIGENRDFCCCECHLCVCPTQSTQVSKYKYVLKYYICIFPDSQMESRRMASLLVALSYQSNNAKSCSALP